MFNISVFSLKQGSSNHVKPDYIKFSTQLYLGSKIVSMISIFLFWTFMSRKLWIFCGKIITFKKRLLFYELTWKK